MSSQEPPASRRSDGSDRNTTVGLTGLCRTVRPARAWECWAEPRVSFPTEERT